MKWIFWILLIPIHLTAQEVSKETINRWNHQAKQVTIIRDNWGIPHIYGKTDADAVFGLMYAQCEDDFNRIELNYVEKLGRMAETEGERSIYNDLLIRLLIDTAEAKSDYEKSPVWLKKLMNAFADGINYYLYKNPQVKPRLLTRFEPWYPLLWTDGSIGAISIADVSGSEIKDFYGGKETDRITLVKNDIEKLTGSNGFAIAPSKTASGNAILYINPHVTFYFRPEVHMSSEEGLNAYGAVTWGQFFVYQGFNEYCGWMHTSGDVDVADSYIENISSKGKAFQYEYNKNMKPVIQKNISIRYVENEKNKQKEFTTYYTHHGPVMAERNGKWISVRSNNRSLKSLVQSWQRTKAKGLADYKKVMDLQANTSNNTVFADKHGNIAYWHGNFIPIRDTIYNWSKPVDGTITNTEWKGLHPVNESVHIYNPANGWIQNCNSTPFKAAGKYSPDKKSYPGYMAPDGENFRGINAVRVLSSDSMYTIEKVISAGYNTYLAAFEILIPALIKAHEDLVPDERNKYNELNEPISILKKWDYHSSLHSVATTLAIEWAQKLTASIQRVYVTEGEPDQVQNTKQFVRIASAAELLEPLQKVMDELSSKFGNWNIPWGEINRFQRLTGNIREKYIDTAASVPVGFVSSVWGQLPSFSSRYYPGTKKRYGYGGNSFVCAVEFGKKIKARSLLAGGQSGNPDSKHFNDQANMYAEGRFKDVWFYKEDVMRNMEKSYNPGREF